METIKLAAAAILIKAGADLATLMNFSGAQQQMNQDRDWWNQYRRLASSRFWTGGRITPEERIRRGGIWADPEFQRSMNQLAAEAMQTELNSVYDELGRGAPVISVNGETYYQPGRAIVQTFNRGNRLPTGTASWRRIINPNPVRRQTGLAAATGAPDPIMQAMEDTGRWVRPEHQTSQPNLYDIQR